MYSEDTLVKVLSGLHPDVLTRVMVRVTESYKMKPLEERRGASTVLPGLIVRRSSGNYLDSIITHLIEYEDMVTGAKGFVTIHLAKSLGLVPSDMSTSSWNHLMGLASADVRLKDKNLRKTTHKFMRGIKGRPPKLWITNDCDVPLLTTGKTDTFDISIPVHAERLAGLIASSDVWGETRRGTRLNLLKLRSYAKTNSVPDFKPGDGTLLAKFTRENLFPTLQEVHKQNWRSESTFSIVRVR